MLLRFKNRHITSGRSLTKAAQELQESFVVSEYHAATLVRTEVSHAHAKADLKAYGDLGIEKYRYLATLDYRTCETCGGFDGQVFDGFAECEEVTFAAGEEKTFTVPENGKLFVWDSLEGMRPLTK